MLARSISIATLAAAVLAALGAGGSPVLAQAEQRISGPHVHHNLAIYLIHGRSAAGAVPLILAEALAKGSVQVAETGQVNELKIENTGAEEVFIQAGDMVKGGRQDRVLTVSLLLPPRSGVDSRSPPSAWSLAAGWREGARTRPASRAPEAMPSRQALLVMAAPPVAEPARPAASQELDDEAESSAPREQGARPRHPGRAAPRPRQQHPRQPRSRQRQPQPAAAGVGHGGQDAGGSGRQRRREREGPRSRPPACSCRWSTPLSRRRARPTSRHWRRPASRTATWWAMWPPSTAGRSAPTSYPSNGLFRKVWARNWPRSSPRRSARRPWRTRPRLPPSPTFEAFLAARRAGQGAGARDRRRHAPGDGDGDHALYNEARSPAGGWVTRATSPSQQPKTAPAGSAPSGYRGQTPRLQPLDWNAAVVARGLTPSRGTTPEQA